MNNYVSEGNQKLEEENKVLKENEGKTEKNDSFSKFLKNQKEEEKSKKEKKY